MLYLIAGPVIGERPSPAGARPTSFSQSRINGLLSTSCADGRSAGLCAVSFRISSFSIAKLGKVDGNFRCSRSAEKTSFLHSFGIASMLNSISTSPSGYTSIIFVTVALYSNSGAE